MLEGQFSGALECRAVIVPSICVSELAGFAKLVPALSAVASSGVAKSGIKRISHPSQDKMAVYRVVKLSVPVNWLLAY